MKNIIKIIAFISILTFFLTSCVKENFEDLPLPTHKVDFEANTTIKDLKEMFDFTDVITDDIIIKGTVISDDKYGNFYKKIVIQDSTGGIEIQVNDFDLYRLFPVGQLVYVKCKNLIIGEYKGVMQLTYDSNGSSERLPANTVKKYIFKSDGGIPIVPKTVKIPELNSEHINTLIKLENVEFDISELALTYATQNQDASRTLTDFAENTLIVRTSSHADFALDTLPSGNGDITAIFTVYNSDKQINIRNTNEVNLTNNRIERVYLLNEDFPGNLGDFSAYSVTGSQNWNYNSQYDCAIMSGYQGGAHENEDWLISPQIDLSTSTNALLTFTHAGKLYGSSWDNVSLQISSDYDGTSNPSNQGNWTEIKNFDYPTSFTFISSGAIDMTDFVGNSSVYIAFKYLSDNSTALKWEIQTVKIIAQ